MMTNSEPGEAPAFDMSMFDKLIEGMKEVYVDYARMQDRAVQRVPDKERMVAPPS